MFNDIRKKIGEVISDANVQAVKERIATTANAAREMAADGVDTVTARMRSPAEIYDEALTTVLYTANTPRYAGEGLRGLISDLKEANPYR
jgi:hypothetical protein